MRRRMRRLARGTWRGAVLCATASATATAQHPTSAVAPLWSVVPGITTVQSANENTLMALNLLASRARLTTIRPFSPREQALLDRLVSDSAEPSRRISAGVAQPWISLFYNSAEPNLQADGAIWQGRGLTAAGGAGATWRLGPIRGSLQPLVFVTQNLSFVPITGASSIVGEFGAPVHGGSIDMPYRFGAKQYARLDPGESWIRADAGPVGAGFTTASQRWGPATQYPVMMGASGPGYPRVFLECFCEMPGLTAKAHWTVGRLESSGFEVSSTGPRVASALVFTLSPHVLSAVEVGASRMFHVPWRGADGWHTATLPFAGLIKAGDPTGEKQFGQQNQLVSAFARVAPANARAELYLEFAREDHNNNWRDFIGEPDHISTYVIGLRRAFVRADSSIGLVTVEAANGRLSHLIRVRGQSPMFLHGSVAEGHTNRGQPLGSYAIPAGGGITARLDAIGSTTASFLQLELRRTIQTAEGGTWDGRSLAAVSLLVGRSEQRRHFDYQWAIGGLQHLPGAGAANVMLELTVRRARR